MKRSGIKRGTKKLKSDPAKMQAWRKRSQPLHASETSLARQAITKKPTRRKLDYEAQLNALTPALLQRSGGICEARIPGKCIHVAVHRHHRKVGRGKGSQDSVAALLHVCDVCHEWIHHHPKISRLQGYLVTRTQDPCTVPVVRLRKVK